MLINTIKPNIDILHECIFAVKVLCYTIVDIALLLAPAAALGITASMVGGLSLLLTVGIVLLCLSMQLAPDKNPSQYFESSQLTNIKTQGRKDIDNILNSNNRTKTTIFSNTII